MNIVGTWNKHTASPKNEKEQGIPHKRFAHLFQLIDAMSPKDYTRN